MLNDIKKNAEVRMKKAIDALIHNFNKIRTGRAHPSLLDGIMVNYYGSETPLSQVANINIEDARTLSVSPWERNLVTEIEKAIMKSDLGLNPSTNNGLIRIPLPMLTEETRKNLIKQARAEAEHTRVAVRNVRRDLMNEVKVLLKDKTISEDDDRRAQDDIQKITDKFIVEVDKTLAAKETDLMAI
jgi:ribosome recycling factor